MNNRFLRRLSPIAVACAATLILPPCNGCSGKPGNAEGDPEAGLSAAQLTSIAEDHYRRWVRQGLRRDPHGDTPREFGSLEEYRVTPAKTGAALLTYSRWNANFSCLVDDSQRSISANSYGIYVTFVSSRSWFRNIRIPDSTMQRTPAELQIDQDPACLLSRSCDPEAFTRAITDRLGFVLNLAGDRSKDGRAKIDDLLQDMKVSLEYLEVHVLNFRREVENSPGSHVEEFEVILTPSGRVLGSRVTAVRIVERW